MGVRDDLEKVALLDAKIYSHIEELERLRHLATYTKTRSC